MKRYTKIAASAVVASALGASMALAGGAAGHHEALGRIEHVNPKSQRITVSHREYRYNPRALAQPLKRGEEVKVVYRLGHGHRIALAIMPVHS